MSNQTKKIIVRVLLAFAVFGAAWSISFYTNHQRDSSADVDCTPERMMALDPRCHPDLPDSMQYSPAIAMLRINRSALEAAYGSCEQGLDVVTWDDQGEMRRYHENIQETRLPDRFGAVVVMCGWTPAEYRGAPLGAPYIISVMR